MIAPGILHNFRADFCASIQNRGFCGILTIERETTTGQQAGKEIEMKKKYPKYVKTCDGFIGVFRYMEFGEFPVYRFPGGDRIADDFEIENGSDDREALL